MTEPFLAEVKLLSAKRVLQGKGISSTGATQFLSGRIVTNAHDRQLLAHELTHVMQQSSSTAYQTGGSSGDVVKAKKRK